MKKALECGSITEYLGATLVSDDLPALRSLVPEKTPNYGALLRWSVSLHGMEAYHGELDAQERNQIMSSWSSSVREIISSMDSSLVEYFPQADQECGEDTVALGTIMSFRCYCKRQGPGSAPSEMSTDELRRVQLLMATDLNTLYPELRLFGAARERCFMGQPVLLNPSVSTEHQKNILRVAASAPLVVEISRNGLDVTLEKDRLLFEKLTTILGNWSAFQTAK